MMFWFSCDLRARCYYNNGIDKLDFHLLVHYGAFIPLLLLLLLLLILALIRHPRRVNIPFKKRRVLITGGTSGIGLALAYNLVLEGANVSILENDQSKLDHAQEAIRLYTGIVITTLKADITDFAALKSAVELVAPIHVLISNHCFIAFKEIDKQSLEDINYMMHVNLMGNFNLLKAALPIMKNDPEGTGPRSIAFMSSFAGQVGVYGYTAISACNFGLRGMAEALQMEVIENNIHISLIFPPNKEIRAEQVYSRPRLSAVVAASSGSIKANAIAKKALDGIRRGTFIIPCSWVGVMLALGTAGISPQRSVFMVGFGDTFWWCCAAIGPFLAASVVGVYGYTAISACNFDLRGMAEALQMEVIENNIHISLIFPPNKEIRAEQVYNRSRLSAVVAASSGSIKANAIAKKALDGIRRGTFIVPCSWVGVMLALGTTGISPQRSVFMAALEILFGGVVRLLALFWQRVWYETIKK